MGPRQRQAAIRIGTCWEEIGVTKCLKSAGKSTGQKPSLVEKDTTAEFHGSCSPSRLITTGASYRGAGAQGGRAAVSLGTDGADVRYGRIRSRSIEW